MSTLEPGDATGSEQNPVMSQQIVHSPEERREEKQDFQPFSDDRDHDPDQEISSFSSSTDDRLLGWWPSLKSLMHLGPSAASPCASQNPDQITRSSSYPPVTVNGLHSSLVYESPTPVPRIPSDDEHQQSDPDGSAPTETLSSSTNPQTSPTGLPFKKKPRSEGVTFLHVNHDAASDSGHEVEADVDVEATVHLHTPPKTHFLLERPQNSSRSADGSRRTTPVDEAHDMFSQKSTSTTVMSPTFRLIPRLLTEATQEVYAVLKEVVAYHAEKLEHRIDLFSTPEFSTTHLKHLLSVATSYAQWSAAASLLDSRLSLNGWKSDPVSSLYDYRLIQHRLGMLRESRLNSNVSNLTFLLRTSLSRNLGDMGNPKLHNVCYIGTKHLIEEYIQEVRACLHTVISSPEMSAPQKLDFLINTRQTFGRSALILSGGSKASLYHIGVIKALHEAGLLPRIISGTSGGSIIAGFAGVHNDTEFASIFHPAHRYSIFGEQKSITELVRYFFQEGNIFTSDALTTMLKQMLGELTFMEAYRKTRRILNVTVSSETAYEMPRVLNYVTAPNVYIWSAIAASCSVPYIFSPSSILCKSSSGTPIAWSTSGHRYIDGSVLNDIPSRSLTSLFNVNHVIVSQVNPHISPFLTSSPETTYVHKLCFRTLAVAQSEMRLRSNQLREMGMLPGKVRMLEGIVQQTYKGDITILPKLTLRDYGELLTNPTPEDVLRGSLYGEKATWPKLSIIRNHLELELELDKLLYFTRLSLIEPQTSSSTLNAHHAYTLDSSFPPKKERRKTSKDISVGHGGWDGAKSVPVLNRKKRSGTGYT